MASQNGHIKVVQLLLDYEAEINLRCIEVIHNNILNLQSYYNVIIVVSQGVTYFLFELVTTIVYYWGHHKPFYSIVIQHNP